jgi:hypothetical protein
VHLQQRLGVSHAARAGSPASTAPPRRRPPWARPDAEARLGARLGELARAHPRWGWRVDSAGEVAGRPALEGGPDGGPQPGLHTSAANEAIDLG